MKKRYNLLDQLKVKHDILWSMSAKVIRWIRKKKMNPLTRVPDEGWQVISLLVVINPTRPHGETVLTCVLCLPVKQVGAVVSLPKHWPAMTVVSCGGKWQQWDWPFVHIIILMVYEVIKDILEHQLMKHWTFLDLIIMILVIAWGDQNTMVFLLPLQWHLSVRAQTWCWQIKGNRGHRWSVL